LVYEHAPRAIITVLNAVSGFTRTNAKALDDFASFQQKLARSDAAWESARTALAESLTRLERMIGVAVESLDEEIRYLGLAAQPDPADHAMAQKLRKLLTEPIEEPKSG